MHFKNGLTSITVFILLLSITSLFAGDSSSSPGPLEIHSEDSSHSLRLQLVGQIRFNYENRDQGDDECREDSHTMEVRRIRLTFSGHVYKPALAYKIHLSTSPGSIELMDFMIDYAFNENFKLRFGQFKIPFTRYRIQSFQRLTFVDWSIVSRYFGAERQIGFSLHNGYENPSRLGYALGLFSGDNARVSHAVGLPEYYNETLVNPSDLSGPGPKAEFNPEIIAHLSYNSPGMDVRSDSDTDRGGLRYSFAASFAWDLDPRPHHDFSYRFAPELLIKLRGLSFFAVAYAGYAEVGDNESNKLVISATLFQTAYRINQRLGASLRYAWVDFDHDLRNDAAQFVDIDSKPVRKHEITAGFDFYLIGYQLKWQHNFGLRKDESSGDDLNHFVYISQFQIVI